MEIQIIFKIASVGILTAVVNQILKYAGKDAGDFYGKKKEGYRRV